MKKALMSKVSRKRTRLRKEALDDVENDSANDDFNPLKTDFDDDDEGIDDDLFADYSDEMEIVNDNSQTFED